MKNERKNPGKLKYSSNSLTNAGTQLQQFHTLSYTFYETVKYFITLDFMNEKNSSENERQLNTKIVFLVLLNTYVF